MPSVSSLPAAVPLARGEFDISSDSPQSTYLNFRCRGKWPRSPVWHIPGLGSPASARLGRAAQAIAQAADKAGHARDLMARDVIDCPMITGAGTGSLSSSRRAASTPNCNAVHTFSWTPITARKRDRDGDLARAFEPSLFVWATVTSRPTEDRAIVVAGLKAFAFDSARRRLRRTRRDLRARLRRARPPRHRGRHQPARARRQDPPDPRPLRPDRQPLRLVCLHPQQPRRAALADYGAGRRLLTVIA
jgi:D-serine deaminase-like pyridoxal phosphate-dependent protein